MESLQKQKLTFKQLALKAQTYAKLSFFKGHIVALYEHGTYDLVFFLLCYFLSKEKLDLKIVNINDYKENDLNGVDVVIESFVSWPESLSVWRNTYSGCYVSLEKPANLDDNGLKINSFCSTYTLLFTGKKPCHFLNDGIDICGQLIDSETYLANEGLVNAKDIQAFLAYRKRNIHKGSNKTALIIGGSLAYSGSIKLANLAISALRSGKGIVKIVTSALGLENYLLESILVKIKENSFSPKIYKPLIESASCALIGPGWGEHPFALETLRLLDAYNKPLILDADALNAISEDLSFLKNHKSPLILTPHPKEMARLRACSLDKVLANPIKIAKDFANKYHVLVLLKGASSVISDGQKVFIVNRGCSGMAKGGMGDVLAGVILGLLQEKSLLYSLISATYITGVAGELAQKDYNDISLLPSDIINYLPKAINYLREDKS